LLRKLSYICYEKFRNMINKRINPTDAELEILQILWDLNEARVKEVHDQINLKKNVGYTTVLKLMQIMFEKGILERKQDGKSHIYKPVVQKEETQEKILDKVLNSVYKGSAYNLVMSALGNYKATDSELEKIKNLIQQQQNKLK